MSLLISQAKAGCVDGMCAMGQFVVFTVIRLDFSEAGCSVQIVMVSGIVPFFQSGVIFVALNQG